MSERPEYVPPSDRDDNYWQAQHDSSKEAYRQNLDSQLKQNDSVNEPDKKVSKKWKDWENEHGPSIVGTDKAKELLEKMKRDVKKSGKK